MFAAGVETISQNNKQIIKRKILNNIFTSRTTMNFPHA